MLTLAGVHAGLGLGFVGLHSSAHYDLVPAAHVWGSLSPSGERPVGFGGTLELQGARWRSDTVVYRFGNGFLRGSGTFDVVAGTHGTVVRAAFEPRVLS